MKIETIRTSNRLKFYQNLARRYNLNPIIYYKNDGIELHLSGSRLNFIKYYIRTLNKEDGFINGFKRIMNILR